MIIFFLKFREYFKKKNIIKKTMNRTEIEKIIEENLTADERQNHVPVLYIL